MRLPCKVFWLRCLYSNTPATVSFMSRLLYLIAIWEFPMCDYVWFISELWIIEAEDFINFDELLWIDKSPIALLLLSWIVERFVFGVCLLSMASVYGRWPAFNFLISLILGSYESSLRFYATVLKFLVLTIAFMCANFFRFFLTLSCNPSCDCSTPVLVLS